MCLESSLSLLSDVLQELVFTGFPTIPDIRRCQRGGALLIIRHTLGKQPASILLIVLHVSSCEIPTLILAQGNHTKVPCLCLRHRCHCRYQ